MIAAALVVSMHIASADSSGIHRTVLTDGVRLLLNPEPDASVLAVTVFVRQSSTSSPAEAAVRSMVNTSLFYGSSNMSSESARELAHRIGSVTTRQTRNYVAISCVTSPARYVDAIHLLGEGLKNAEFSAAALETARTDLIRARENRRSDPFMAAYDDLTSAIDARNEPDAVQLRHVTQEQAVGYYAKTFVPANTVVSVVGKFDTMAIQRMLDNELVDYDRASRTGAATESPQSEIPERATLITMRTSGTVSYALTGVKTPTVSDPDYPAFYVMSTLLGGGHSSRMFRQIRDESGIGYTVGTALHPEDGEPMIGYVEWDSDALAGGKPIKPTTVVRLIESQLDSLIATDATVTEMELERARSFAAGQYLLKHQRIQDRCFLPGFYEAIGASYEFDAQLPAHLTAVSREDLLRVARKYLPAHLSILTIGSK